MYQIKYLDPHTSQVLEVVSHSLAEAVEKIKLKRDELYFKGWVSPDKQESREEEREEKPSEDQCEYDAAESEQKESKDKPEEFRYESYFYDDIDDDYGYYGCYY